MGIKLNKFLVTWQETEHIHDDYYDSRGGGGTYPVTVDKFAMIADVNDLQKYVTYKNVRFFALGEELKVKLNTTVEVLVTATTRGT